MKAHKLAPNGGLWEWHGDSLGICLAEEVTEGYLSSRVLE